MELNEEIVRFIEKYDAVWYYINSDVLEGMLRIDTDYNTVDDNYYDLNEILDEFEFKTVKIIDTCVDRDKIILTIKSL